MTSCSESEEAEVHDPEDVSAVPGRVGSLSGSGGLVSGLI